jgi:ribonucleoside-diphosphate reductase alpha chain
VPLKVLCDKFSHMRFEPSGFTGNPDIPIAKSISDYLFRWLALKFLPSEDVVAEAPQNALPPGSAPTGSSARAAQQTVEAKPLPSSSQANGHANGSNGVQTAYKRESDAPPCPTCGSITVRNGACYKCVNCGSTTGCS